MLIELINQSINQSMLFPDDDLTKKNKIGYNINLRFSRKAIEKGKKNGGVAVRSKDD